MIVVIIPFLQNKGYQVVARNTKRNNKSLTIIAQKKKGYVSQKGIQSKCPFEGRLTTRNYGVWGVFFRGMAKNTYVTNFFLKKKKSICWNKASISSKGYISLRRDTCFVSTSREYRIPFFGIRCIFCLLG